MSSTRGNFGIVHEVDAEHEHEVVGDDALFEVGAGLADLQEAVELGVGRRVGHRGPPHGCRARVPGDEAESSRSARRAPADRLASGHGYFGHGPLDAGRRSPIGIRPRTAAQLRVIGAALDLFAEHGVGGTSLQMIADAIGVTKAAVYHQFKTKDEIVLAAAEVELARVEAAWRRPRPSPTGPARGDLLVTRIVDLAVERRRMESTLLGDPVIIRLFAHHEPFRQVMDRLYRLLAGADAGPDARVPAAMLTPRSAVRSCTRWSMDLDDETLRSQLRRLARRFLDLPDETR